MKWDIVREKKRLVFCETTIWGGEQREAWGSAPNSGLIFLLFLSYQWLDQAWWMTEGCSEGWGVDKTCSQSRPSPHNVRKTRDCCVWATEVGGGALGRSMRVPGGPCMGSVVRQRCIGEAGVSSIRGVYCWHPAPMNMYVCLFTCSKDGPPG